MTREQYEKLKQLSIKLGVSLTAAAASVAMITGGIATAIILDNKNAKNRENLIDDLYAMEDTSDYRESVEKSLDNLNLAFSDGVITLDEFYERAEAVSDKGNVINWARNNPTEKFESRLDEYDKVVEENVNKVIGAAFATWLGVFGAIVTTPMAFINYKNRKKLKSEIEKYEEENEQENEM